MWNLKFYHKNYSAETANYSYFISLSIGNFINTFSHNRSFEDTHDLNTTQNPNEFDSPAIAQSNAFIMTQQASLYVHNSVTLRHRNRADVSGADPPLRFWVGQVCGMLPVQKLFHLSVQTQCRQPGPQWRACFHVDALRRRSPLLQPCRWRSLKVRVHTALLLFGSARRVCTGASRQECRWTESQCVTWKHTDLMVSLHVFIPLLLIL